MQIPLELLAALKADLANPAAAWLCVSADETLHETSVPSPVEGEPPIVTVDRHVTVTIESTVRGLVLIFMLEGRDGQVPTSGKVYYRGNSFQIDDAGLLESIDGKVSAVNQLYADELVGKLSVAL